MPTKYQKYLSSSFEYKIVQQNEKIENKSDQNQETTNDKNDNCFVPYLEINYKLQVILTKYTKKNFPKKFISNFFRLISIN